ncbi:MAG: CopG family transcriptional regulator [Flavobacteriales bacterium]|nr:CopG family transcriptional regulator [Flavobacteriales bacterium]
MTTYTSSLPDELFEQLDQKAKELKVPKNQLIEKALSIYLNQFKRLEYIRSYKRMKGDEDLIQLAEEGMQNYLKRLEDEES